MAWSFDVLLHLLPLGVGYKDHAIHTPQDELTGGVVFVADSQWEKMEENVESFRNLEENLAQQNISIDEIPYVLQYNKRDLGNIAPVNYLEFLLNNRKKRVQSFEVISSTGQNVFASLNAVSQMLLHKFSKQSDVPSNATPQPVAVAAETAPTTPPAAT